MSTDDGYPTTTSEEQARVEKDVLRMFGAVINSTEFDPENSFVLNREQHVEFLRRGLSEPLRASFISLEASRAWIAYWILHSLDLLGERDLILAEFSESIPAFLAACQHPSGGFGGGPHQLPHLATTYAAVAALVTIGTDEAMQVIDRPKLREFILSLKDPATGGFYMHQDGEIDIRGTYCAIAVSSMVRILDDSIATGVAEYVASCQTYEGGIAGEPGMEAHGGYSYCGLAAVAILGTASSCLRIDEFNNWLSRRQMRMEGGFQGRANKLVDSCYTFWQGASFAILAEIAEKRPLEPMFSPDHAQMYVLLACQVATGGFRDKPGKSPDFYHSCYSLSGLAALQYPTNSVTVERVLGPESQNRLTRNCVFYNVCLDRVEAAREFFSSQPILGTEGLGVIHSRQQ